MAKKIRINVDLIYPIGSIYMSVKATNPSTYFGGTWTAWGTGRVPVGIDTSQTEFNTVEKTGGNKTHALVKDEIPNLSIDTTNISSSSITDGYIMTGGYDKKHEGLNVGGTGKSFSIIQPYITCYMWKRTA